MLEKGDMMLKLINKKDCCGCFACYNICPKECISMLKDSEGFSYPQIDSKKCIECNLCEKVCPIINRYVEGEDKLEGYYGYINDDNIRLGSSSGGIFSAIADYVIENKGIVIGASFDDNFAVKHSIIESKRDLWKLRGSKYVQSEINDIFKCVRDFLDDNRLVLFTGTPCQVAGLKKYLQKKYDNLYTVDILCHGVPSPKVWSKYINEKEKEYGSKIFKINFRNKDEGWNNFSLKINFENGAIYKNNIKNDLYLKFFLNHLSLRPSCHSCKFKSLNRASDLTIGDAWGIDKIDSSINSYNGVSLVIVHSEKGERLIKIRKIADK